MLKINACKGKSGGTNHEKNLLAKDDVPSFAPESSVD